MFWQSGKMVTAYYLYLNCPNDNLKDSALFYWALYDKNVENEPGNLITNGNIEMTGTDYENWDSNEYAFNWAAGVLGLEYDNTQELINENIEQNLQNNENNQ